jgi:hypothetical protein
MRQPKAIQLIQLRDALKSGPSTASELRIKLGVSQPTISRLLGQLGNELITRGRTKRTRYAMRRAWRGSLEPFPVYRVDETGKLHRVTSLALTLPSGSACDLAQLDWPAIELMADGWFEGLPYPLADMHPHGFLGRNFARQNAARLHVSDNPLEWSDDDIVTVLTQGGLDFPGNLLLGAEAAAAFLAEVRQGAEVCTDADVPTRYPEFAAQAMAGGTARSSAGGEFPKFTVVREREGRIYHAIVKFSGDDASAAVRRWADLLRCEQRAATIIRHRLRVATAASTIIEAGGRTFLEVERFDRHGAYGRSAVCTLLSLDAALVGSSDSDWTRVVRQLDSVTALEPGVLESVDTLWWFGELIANSDMHKGNLAFTPGPPLGLSPAYDMLPMRYAPARSGELPNPIFEPSTPLPEYQSTWQSASNAAIQFWEEVHADTHIDASLHALAEANASFLRELRARL